MGFFDSIGQDILSLVEETRLTGQMPLSLNSTFIALIPKKDNRDTLDDFRPISLCNCIYKIISKVIARRLKIVLSENLLGTIWIPRGQAYTRSNWSGTGSPTQHKDQEAKECGS